jgi:hypothetical protein
MQELLENDSKIIPTIMSILKNKIFLKKHYFLIFTQTKSFFLIKAFYDFRKSFGEYGAAPSSQMVQWL